LRTVLIDTDILLDFFYDRQPFANSAESILAMCEQGQIRGYTTSVIISNCYYLLRKTAGHKKVVRQLRKLLNILHVLVTDKPSLLQALDSEFSDFEDAIQHYSALSSGEVNVIITRNIKDYKKSDIAVLSPDEFLAALK